MHILGPFSLSGGEFKEDLLPVLWPEEIEDDLSEKIQAVIDQAGGKFRDNVLASLGMLYALQVLDDRQTERTVRLLKEVVEFLKNQAAHVDTFS